MERLTSLPTNHIFVFGSNESGFHGAGAARDALNYFGAKYGYGMGRYGQSYAIPTKDRDLVTLPLDKISRYVANFLWYARKYHMLTYHLTPIGTGLAGYEVSDIAPLFVLNRYENQPANIIYPNEFMEYWWSK